MHPLMAHRNVDGPIRDAEGKLEILAKVFVLLRRKVTRYWGISESRATRSRVRWTPSLPTDVSTLCRTSGTVGDPKGVVQLPRNLTYAAHQDSKKLAIYPTDVPIEYLPLVHAMERAELALMCDRRVHRLLPG
ncbi:hypothetical protein PF007_g16558 [Phytophthora fragariae]|uniref:AMP-dependent synthetase/ligase domain-containing protein n=2 Tax=Phytophthora fragariae TaxID=53985 RepID=A0A6A3RJA8_9STRA|nr:hypothetical protein PF007_g16558 [Phytophthora fragariae]KAE9291809.1 hypothetical protein PF008_g25236 [Phytophthora fragariae]